MKQGLGKEYLRLFVRAAVFLLILYVVFTRVLFLGRVTGMEMYPSLKDGDLALGYRLEREYRTGDIIVYEADGARHFGRIAAKETGEKAKEPAEETLPVQQDDQTDTEDSPDCDEIPREQVKAKIITILRRRGL